MTAPVQYLRFVDVVLDDRKTKIVNVMSTSRNFLLGRIKWYGAWRQYTFHPEPQTVWNPECLDVINERIRVLMKAREEQ